MLAAKRCTVCADPIGSNNKSGFCMWHRPRNTTRKCKSCGGPTIYGRALCNECLCAKIPFYGISQDRIDDYRELRDSGMTAHKAAEYIKSGKPIEVYHKPKPTVISSEVISIVAKCAYVCAADIVGPYRYRELIVARSASAYIMHQHGFSYSSISRRLGKKDHTSAINLVKRWPVYAAKNPILVKNLMAENILTADPAF